MDSLRGFYVDMLQDVMKEHLLPESKSLPSNLDSVLNVISDNQLIKNCVASLHSSASTEYSAKITKLIKKWNNCLMTLINGKEQGKRWASLNLLNETISQLSGDFTLFNGFSSVWISNLLQIMKRQELEEIHSYSAISISTIIEVVSNKSSSGIFQPLVSSTNATENWGEIKRNISTDLFPKIIPILLSLINNDSSSSKNGEKLNESEIETVNKESSSSSFHFKKEILYSLFKMITSFPSSTKPFVNRIEESMISLLFSLSTQNISQSNKEIVIQISSILQTLPNCVGSGSVTQSDSQSDSSLQINERSNSHQSRSQTHWSSFVNRIIAYMHTLIGEVFIGLESKNTPLKITDNVDFTSFSNYLQVKKLKKIQLENIFEYLSTILSILLSSQVTEEYSKNSGNLQSLPVQNILNLINRVLSVNHLSLINKIANREESELIERVNSLLHTISLFHQHALNILSSLIISGRHSLVLFSKQIANIINLNLTNPINSTVKEILYKCCCYLFDNCGSSLYYISSRRSVEKQTANNESNSFVYQLLDFIILDISFISANKKSIIQNPNKKRKVESNTTEMMNNESSNNTRSDLFHSFSYSVSLAALKVLKRIIETCGACISVKKRSEIDQLIVHTITHNQTSILLIEDIHSINNATYKFKYLIRLLKCLMASVLVHTRNSNSKEAYDHSSILSVSIFLFKRNINHSSNKIRNLCKNFLSICENIVHPRYFSALQVSSTLPITSLLASSQANSSEKEIPSSFSSTIVPEIVNQPIHQEKNNESIEEPMQSQEFVKETTTATANPLKRKEPEEFDIQDFSIPNDNLKSSQNILPAIIDEGPDSD